MKSIVTSILPFLMMTYDKEKLFYLIILSISLPPLEKFIKFLTSLKINKKIVVKYTYIDYVQILKKNIKDKNMELLGKWLIVSDGYTTLKDCIVIFTTNHKENLDDALIRAGRIDKKWDIDIPSKPTVENMFSFFYDCDIKIPETYKPKHSNADVINRIIIGNSKEYALKLLME